MFRPVFEVRDQSPFILVKLIIVFHVLEPLLIIDLSLFST